MSIMADLIVIGGGGHAKVVANTAQICGYKIKGFLDDDQNCKQMLSFSRLGCIDDCIKHTDAEFIIAIGNNEIRKRVFQRHSDLKYATLVHPNAIIGSNVKVGIGTVVMPGAIVNADTVIGDFCVINSGAVVEHDCNIGNYTFLAPHSTMCGFVTVGDNCWIGAGSTINNVVKICRDVTLGSGAVLVKDATQPGTYIGVPARRIEA